MKRLLSVFGLLALAQPALAQTVLDSDFTISVPRSPGQADVVESTTLVPLLTGTCYNWHLRLSKTKGSLEITEIYTLPEAPENWGLGSDAITISKNRRTATSALLVTPVDGWIENGWCVTDGDPEGPYSFEIKSGDMVLHRFEFELKAM